MTSEETRGRLARSQNAREREGAAATHGARVFLASSWRNFLFYALGTIRTRVADYKALNVALHYWQCLAFNVEDLVGSLTTIND